MNKRVHLYTKAKFYNLTFDIKVISKATLQHLNSGLAYLSTTSLLNIAIAISDDLQQSFATLRVWLPNHLCVHTLNSLNYPLAVSLSANVNPYIIRSPAAVKLVEQMLQTPSYGIIICYSIEHPSTLSDSYRTNTLYDGKSVNHHSYSSHINCYIICE